MYVHFGAFDGACPVREDFPREDLARLHNAGITHLRYPALWRRIELQPGEFDWTALDAPLAFMREAEMHPVLDTLRYTSAPRWLSGGPLNPSFPELYARFLDRLSTRYPFVRSYTTLAEPLTPGSFASERDFVATALRLGDAIRRGCHSLRRTVSARMLHVEAAQHHVAIDRRCTNWARFCNVRRFLLTELILGRVTRDHSLYAYLIANAVSQRELEGFSAAPVSINTLGLHYSLGSETAWRSSSVSTHPNPVAAVPHPRGFASIAEDYALRYRLPIMLAGTAITGSVRDRIAWLKLMESECEELVLSGVDFRGFCWFPSFDLAPRGIWNVHPGTLERSDTELSACYSQLARSSISSAHLPPYPFASDLHKRLRGYFRKTRDAA